MPVETRRAHGRNLLPLTRSSPRIRPLRGVEGMNTQCRWHLFLRLFILFFEEWWRRMGDRGDNRSFGENSKSVVKIRFWEDWKISFRALLLEFVVSIVSRNSMNDHRCIYFSWRRNIFGGFERAFFGWHLFRRAWIWSQGEGNFCKYIFFLGWRNCFENRGTDNLIERMSNERGERRRKSKEWTDDSVHKLVVTLRIQILDGGAPLACFSFEEK